MRLYGGPSKDYPAIAMITWRQSLKVVGCDRRVGWCEVLVDGQRGWVEGNRLTWPTMPAYRAIDLRHDAVHVTI
ncbi:SH3 domain-containing protein [Rhizobium setariae]